jgi:simple sugar transport system permease protein
MAFILLTNSGLVSVIAFFIALGIASCIGLANGIITVRTGIPSFITTLGTMMFLRGILLAVSRGFTISYSGHSTFITALSLRFAGGFRTSVFWFIGLAILFAMILGRTRYGNWVFATGDDKEVARAMGVNPDRVKLTNFMLSGVLAGFAGCVNLARFKLVDPTMGMGMELEAISAAVIGGTLLSGGYGSIVGAFIGAILIGMIRSGLILAGAPTYWYQAFIGVILIVAAIINIRIRRMVAG